VKEFAIEMVPIDKLIPYVNNPKAHPEAQVEKIIKSIKEFGIAKNIVINAENVVICGHGSLAAYQKLGVGVVPAFRVTDLTPAQEKALRIADNRSAESPWDQEKLLAELESLKGLDYDLKLTGFDEGEVRQLMSAGGHEQEAFQPNTAPQVSGEEVTERDMDRAGDTLDGKFAEKTQETMEVVCPACAHRMTVQKGSWGPLRMP
jgi:hypothetical protein